MREALVFTSLRSHAHFCSSGGLKRSNIVFNGRDWWKVGEDIDSFSVDSQPAHSQVSSADSLLQQTDALSLGREAHAAFRRNDFRGAIPLFRKFLKSGWPGSGPHLMAVHDNLAQALAQTGKEAQAEKHFRKALKLAPEKERPRIKKNLCFLLSNLGRGSEEGCARSDL